MLISFYKEQIEDYGINVVMLFNQGFKEILNSDGTRNRLEKNYESMDKVISDLFLFACMNTSAKAFVKLNQQLAKYRG